MFSWVIVSIMFVIPVTSYFFLPLFYELGVHSINEYLDLRFNSATRRLASAAFVLQMMFYLSIVVYGPSLALSQVTGTEIFISVTILFGVCIFYTVIGGLKAVVWTDTMQIIVMYGSLGVTIVNGVMRNGGMTNVWELNRQSGRIEFFNFDTDLTTRHTVWSVLVGNFVYWLAVYGTSQIQMQRFLATPSLKKAKQALWVNLFGLILIMSLSCFAGLVIYAHYSTCDPKGQGRIEKIDQLFPLFVMDTLGHLPGLPGLFVAGIFSGALSTISSCLNAIALTILEDMVRPCYPHMTDSSATKISKFISLAFGVICFGCVFIVANVKGIIEAVLSFNSSIGGPMLGIFTLGLFVPWANSIGTIIGATISFVFMLWLSVSTQMAKSDGLLRHPLKPLTLEGCNMTNITLITTTLNNTIESSSDDVASILKLSYMWYSVFGFTITLIVGTIISFGIGRQDPKKLNPKLIVNLGEKIFWFCPVEVKEFFRFGVGDHFVHEKDDKCCEQINEGFHMDEMNK